MLFQSTKSIFKQTMKVGIIDRKLFIFSNNRKLNRFNKNFLLLYQYGNDATLELENRKIIQKAFFYDMKYEQTH